MTNRKMEIDTETSALEYCDDMFAPPPPDPPGEGGGALGLLMDHSPVRTSSWVGPQPIPVFAPCHSKQLTGKGPGADPRVWGRLRTARRVVRGAGGTTIHGWAIKLKSGHPLSSWPGEVPRNQNGQTTARTNPQKLRSLGGKPLRPRTPHTPGGRWPLTKGTMEAPITSTARPAAGGPWWLGEATTDAPRGTDHLWGGPMSRWWSWDGRGVMGFMVGVPEVTAQSAGGLGASSSPFVW